MKNLLQTLMCLLFAACLSAACQNARTVAEGEVKFPDPNNPRPYTPFVLEERGGGDMWVEWGVWKQRNVYALVAMPGDELHAMWIDALTADTLATLKVCGGERPAKYDTPIVLDGTNYYFGCPIETVEALLHRGTPKPNKNPY